MSRARRQSSELAVDTSTPILVLRRSLGSFQRCALAVIRSAGRLGIPVFSVRHNEREPATRSRYAAGALDLDPDAPAGEWIEALIALRSQVGRAILLPIDDEAAIAVSEHQDRLAEHYLVAAAPPGIQRRLASKRELWDLCRELDLPIPRCTFPADESELREQAAEHGYPVVVKRAESWLPPRDENAPRVLIARTPEQLLEAYRRMESDVSPQILLQEYVPGGSEAVWTFDGYAGAGGECLCAFTGRRLRQQGPRTGQTTLGICARNEAVADIARRLLRDVEYRGVVDIGFHYDRRDGSYKLFDVNPRLGSSFRMFVGDDGLDVVRALHLDLTGRPVPPSTATEGRKWIDEPSDLSTAIKLAREGSLGLRAWSRSLRGVDETTWWAADDPIPFLGMIAQAVPRAAGIVTGQRGR